MKAVDKRFSSAQTSNTEMSKTVFSKDVFVYPFFWKV